MRQRSGGLLISFNARSTTTGSSQGAGPDGARSALQFDTEVLLAAWSAGVPRPRSMVGQWAFPSTIATAAGSGGARSVGENLSNYHADPRFALLRLQHSALLKAPWVGRELDPEALANT